MHYSSFSNNLKSLQKANSQKGYIALISAIIISVVMLGLITAVSTSGFFTRFNVLDGENKRVSLGLADSCQQVALLAEVKNSTSLQGQTILVGSSSCFVKSVKVTPSSTDPLKNVVVVETQATFKGAFSDLEMSVNAPQTPPPPYNPASGPPPAQSSPTSVDFNFWKELPSPDPAN